MLRRSVSSNVSTGDNISGTGQSSSTVDVGIVTIPIDYGDYDIAPSGDWLMTAPSGCAVCDDDQGARVCVSVRLQITWFHARRTTGSGTCRPGLRLE
ncbi:MAG: hypothetical protein SGJ24_18890 [Chloroflexota bacterium]|nr:hypothetical protein [Chloroflexota bacterium]